MSLEEYGIPSALKSIYPLTEPNQSIRLYEGTLEVLQEGISRKGDGVIYLKWFPSPRIEFQITCQESLQFRGVETTFKFPEIESPVKALVSINDRFNLTERSIQITGRVREPIIIGLGQSLSYLHFHLTNFEDFYGTTSVLIEDDKGLFVAQRATLEAGGWRVTIDQLKSTTDDIKILKSQGGYTVTHIGKLEKVSGDLFTADDGRTTLSVLSDFLSFVKGFMVVPILLVGYDSKNNPIWQEWAESKTASSWQNVNSWAWGLTAKNFVKAFPGFWNWRQSWSDAARRAIYWYVESNTQAGAIEGSCVLEQATLELIAWTYLATEFESDAKLPSKQQQFRHSSQKINHLLARLDIPQTIPSDLTTLVTLASNQNWDSNGALVFVKIRNDITHSDPSNQNRLQNTSVNARIEAWELGLWYLELVLLRLFDYQGVYFNRLRRGTRYFGDLDIVPWVDQYIQAALSKATYEILESNSSFSGKISEFENLQASAETLEVCQQKLEKALKDWIVVELSRGNSLPVINGIDVNHPTGDMA